MGCENAQDNAFAPDAARQEKSDLRGTRVRHANSPEDPANTPDAQATRTFFAFRRKTVARITLSEPSMARFALSPAF